jgi:hypothetical protein
VSPMTKVISLNEMRERVGPVLFGEDWIGEATDGDWKLITGDYGIKQGDRHTADGIRKKPTIKPCPKTLAPKLERALGRHARADAQYSAVDSWLEDLGFLWTADRKLFNKALNKEKTDAQAAPPQKNQPGPKPKVLPRIMAAMTTDLNDKKLSRDQFEKMPDKELEFRYEARRQSVREARKRVLLATREKPIPTIPTTNK